MDQVFTGISAAKVLVAELTMRNPNVFYELGLAHALKKPVVLVSSNEDDVPFDLHHIRVAQRAWCEAVIARYGSGTIAPLPLRHDGGRASRSCSL